MREDGGKVGLRQRSSLDARIDRGGSLLDGHGVWGFGKVSSLCFLEGFRVEGVFVWWRGSSLVVKVKRVMCRCHLLRS